jgi:hypothetical protein
MSYGESLWAVDTGRWHYDDQQDDPTHARESAHLAELPTGAERARISSTIAQVGVGIVDQAVRDRDHLIRFSTVDLSLRAGKIRERLLAWVEDGIESHLEALT